MKNDKFSKQGRIINRTANDTEITIYLGLENVVNNFNVVQEYIKFEDKYMNKNVEFCLICDIESKFIEPTKIIEKGEYIVVYE